MDTLFDCRALFEAYQESRPAADQGVRVERVALTSAHDDVLVEEDRGIAANTSFHAPLLTPDRDGPWDEVVVLFHGLNEGTEAKLLPWAANLARRGMPALVFPSSFHLARRPPAFLEARGDAFAARRAVEGNARSSPYNALLSKRMAERPDRFVRGTMQTYRDVVDLARGLRDGAHPTLSSRFARGARVSFLAYSIGGYLAKVALLADPEGLFSDSRCVLFSTGAALADVRPQTILILDTDGQQRLYAHYDTDEGRAGRHPSFDDVRADAKERAALTAMLYAGSPLVDPLRALGGRVAGIANVADTVFPWDAVRKTFATLSCEQLELGLHELPFNQRGPLGETYSDKEGRRLLLAVVRSYAVGEDLRPQFAKFVDLCAQQLIRSAA